MTTSLLKAFFIGLALNCQTFFMPAATTPIPTPAYTISTPASKINTTVQPAKTNQQSTPVATSATSAQPQAQLTIKSQAAPAQNSIKKLQIACLQKCIDLARASKSAAGIRFQQCKNFVSPLCTKKNAVRATCVLAIGLIVGFNLYSYLNAENQKFTNLCNRIIERLSKTIEYEKIAHHDWLKNPLYPTLQRIVDYLRNLPSSQHTLSKLNSFIRAAHNNFITTCTPQPGCANRNRNHDPFFYILDEFWREHSSNIAIPTRYLFTCLGCPEANV